jgi:NitT/TauT family transport system ATP-binding protein
MQFGNNEVELNPVAPEQHHDYLSVRSDRAVLIALTGVGKTYASSSQMVEAVDSISLPVYEGEFVSLLGPSGCGKSTLLMMIAGLLPTTRGRITIANTTVARPQTNIGIVFQNHVLLDWRTALENVMIQVEARGLGQREYRGKALELLSTVGLDGFAHRYPWELSGGMRQRVSICRALIHDPPLLLMDEPFGALDALTREQLMVDLQRLWLKTRKTVVFVTHNIAEAVFLSDRIVVMTPRPGAIDRVIDVQIPRPRRLRVTRDAQFSVYTSQIMDLFKSRGVITEDDDDAELQARPGNTASVES